jgi:hypothetical protein
MDSFFANDGTMVALMRTHKWYNENKYRLSKGLPERKHGELLPLDEINETVDSEEFNNLAHGKLLIGYYRYTDPNNLKPNVFEVRHDFIQAMKNKIKRYEETHNLELLVDVRNYAMLEFRKPKFADAYYENEDDTEHAPLKQQK